MRTLLIFLFIACCLSACKDKQGAGSEKLFENNTEPKDWINESTVRELEGAYSGNSCSVTDSLHPYSLGFRKKMNAVPSSKTVNFSYWIKLKGPSSRATTVFSVDSGAKNISWKGVSANQKVSEYNKWIQISESFEIPAGATPEDVLSLYVWNNAGDEVMIDDLRIMFE